MPYIIRDFKEGYKVCKKDKPSECFSRKPIPLNRAIKQRKAIGITKSGGSNPDAELVKGLSGAVFDVAESIPGFGTFLGTISGPIKAGLNAITDAIMYDPDWERKQKNKAEWTEYIREMSLHKYGRELTPEEYRYVQWELKKRRMAKLAKERAEAIERDTKRAKEAGFKTIGEYTANIKTKGREDLKERLKRAGFVSGREYTAKKKAGEISEEQRKIVEGKGKSRTLPTIADIKNVLNSFNVMYKSNSRKDELLKLLMDLKKKL